MNELINKIYSFGIVPVIKIDNIDTAVPLADALISAGLPVAEVTFRTAQAEESIKRIVKAYPQMIVGAGTVLSVEQLSTTIIVVCTVLSIKHLMQLSIHFIAL